MVQRVEALGAGRLDPDVLEEGGKVMVAWQVDPEVHSVVLHDAPLVLLKEEESAPLPVVWGACQVEDDIGVVWQVLVRDEAAIEVHGVREVRSDFPVEEVSESCEEGRPVRIPAKVAIDLID